MTYNDIVTNLDVLYVMILVLIIFIIARLYPVLIKPTPQTGVISGGVTYNGAAVAGATVTLYYEDGIEAAVATTNESGVYTLQEMAVDKYHMTAILRNADGSWLQADKDVNLETQALVVDLVMESIGVLVVKQ